MRQTFLVAGLVVFSAAAQAASFPHKTAIYETTMAAPMMQSTSTSYVFFDGNIGTAISAEWRTEEMMGRKSRMLTLSKQGKVYSVDLEKRSCTRTDISAMTGSIADPEAFARKMRDQMGMKASGSCDGAGLKGTLYKSGFGDMCMYKDAFMLWQKSMGSDIRVTSVAFDKDLPKDKISLPAGIDCVDGPDLSRGMMGMREYSRSRDEGAASAPAGGGQPSQQDMEEAMKQAKEAMKQFGDMFSR